jgi:hypothetical protein
MVLIFNFHESKERVGFSFSKSVIFKEDVRPQIGCWQRSMIWYSWLLCAFVDYQQWKGFQSNLIKPLSFLFQLNFPIKAKNCNHNMYELKKKLIICKEELITRFFFNYKVLPAFASFCFTFSMSINSVASQFKPFIPSIACVCRNENKKLPTSKNMTMLPTPSIPASYRHRRHRFTSKAKYYNFPRPQHTTHCKKRARRVELSRAPINI